MAEEITKAVESGAQVVEQRIKPTLIRRRAKKVEALPEAPPEPVEAQEAEAALPPAEQRPEEKREAPAPVPRLVGSILPPPAAVAAPAPSAPVVPMHASQGPVASASPVPQQPLAETRRPGGPKLAAPSEAERRIGVVGYIDLSTTTQATITRVKEDWRDRLKRAPKKRKDRAELEMEAIQRTGGLKQYVGAFGEEEPSSELPPEAAAMEAAAMPDRVFQPGISSKRRRQTIRRGDFKKTAVTEPKAIKKVIRVEEGISVSALSQALGIKANDIIKKLMGLGVMATVNQQVDVGTAALIAGEQGFTVEHTAFKEEEILVEPEAHASALNLAHRAPVVTVMGHVDHGKTSILDVIRKANVAEGEAGGITQHIGAYEVKHPKGTITFLDTPGHEAFTMMRARGAQATDLVILVVAADDGVMPQTVEAISHAKAAEVPIIVAVNKIDKPNAQPDRVKQSLTEYGLVPEEWGGDVICVPTSAKMKTGIDQLLDMILLQSEMLELSADPTIRPKGIVIEASLDKNRGPMATVLIQEGTLTLGAYVVCGTAEGKVRAMFDHEGKQVKEAGPSKPVAILGLTGVPAAGDEMVGVSDERGARLITEQRRMRERERGLVRPTHISLEDLSKQMEAGEQKELSVILKTDVQGSLEAVSDAITKLSTDQVCLKVLLAGVGGITESDIMLASASDAVVLGFNVTPDAMARQAADRENIDVRTYRIIYEMIDQVRKAMEGLLAPELKEVALGQATVKEVFKITKVGAVAGCQVSSGKIVRSARVRLVRDGKVVYEGKLASLKRFKDDVREVAEGYECGMSIENFNDIKAGDVIEAFMIESKAATL